jgi:histidinol-phosphate aminotransferase
MSDFGRFLPEYIRRLAQVGETRPLKQPSRGSKPVLLNLNENPFGPSPLAVRAVQAAFADVYRYPEIQAIDLHRAIASFHQVQPAQVLVTAGATDLLGMIARALLGPGLNAITSARSFIVYKLATQVTEGRLIEVPTRNDGYDLDAIARAIDGNTRIVFIANPNNPTGSLLGAAELDAFADALPDHVLLVLDEAYGDFAEYFVQQRAIRSSGKTSETRHPRSPKPGASGTPGLPTPALSYSRALDYVNQDRNVILLKTFSKTHGLAGLRVGFGIGPARLMSLFAPLRTIFSVSSLAQAAAAAALDDFEHIQCAVRNNAEQEQVLARGLQDLGFHPPQTWANFLYIELQQQASRFADRLREHDIVVQPLALWGAPTAIRVSIGTPEENQQFLEGMAALRH